MKTIPKIIAIILLTIVFILPQNTLASTDLPQSESLTDQYIYRFWSPIFKGHFFTMDHNEATHVANNDSNWNFEKIGYSAFSIQQPGTLPVYRFWSPVFKGHFYTMNQEEWLRVKDTDTNWTYEWIAFYAYPSDYEGEANTVYRFWSPVFRHHFFTIDEEEMQRVRDNDPNWDYEGIAFKVPLDDTNQTIQGEEDELLESDNAAIQVEEARDVTDEYPAQAVSGEKLIATQVYFLNTGNEPFEYSLYDFVLKNLIDGTFYHPQPIAEPVLVGGTLEPGDSVEGFLTFSIPEDLNQFVLEYADGNMEIKNNRINIELDVTPSVVIISHEEVMDNFSGKKIIGSVKNNTKEPVRLVKLIANFYDSAMNMISTDFSFAEGTDIDYLNPSETADFRIWYDNDPGVEFYDLGIEWKTD